MTIAMKDKVFIRGMELYGYVGVLERERRDGQIFRVGVALGLDLRAAGESDRLEHTANYATIFEIAQGLMRKADCRLLEAYAERLASELLETFPLASEVEVEVEKPNAPIEGVFDTAGVVIRRRRDG